MRKKVCIFILSTLNFGALLAQGVFYNNGDVVIKSDSKTNTVVYIQGGLVGGSNSAFTSRIKVDKAKVVLTGDLINDVNTGVTGGTVFESTGVADPGVVEFRGAKAQRITTSRTTTATIPSKLYNFVNFPDLEVNNNKHLTVDPQLAAKTKNIELTKGWLILDSDVATIAKDGASNPDNQTVLAHLFVDGSVNYNKSNWNSLSNVNDRGFVEVRLQIPSEGTRAEKSIIGFGSPFKETRSDYFIYNTLLAPSPAGFVGGGALGAVIAMKAGVGYVTGIDLRGTDPSNYPETPLYPGISFAQRAHKGYYFNRHKFANDSERSGNQIFGTNASAAPYTMEEINTEDVAVSLSAGFNYLSNPYTTPLNIDKLLGNNEAATDWKINSNATAQMPQMQNKVWILHPTSVAELVAGDPTRSTYTHNYYLAQAVGGTYVDEDSQLGVTAIAPLQMFVIRAYSTASSITIPKNQRVSGTTKFIRNIADHGTRKRQDDFVIEVRDEKNYTGDRVSFVFRTGEEIASNPNLRDVERMASTSTDGVNNAGKDVKQSFASQLYTKDVSGNPLTVQFLDVNTTSSLNLYHTPPSVAQDISIIPLRMETLDKVKEMWLEDRKYNTRIDLTQGIAYKTNTQPTDRTDRFVLHFKKLVGIENDVQGAINAYQEQSAIWIEGFETADMGSQVLLYDLNGKLLAKKEVVDQSFKLADGVQEGVYIIKTLGNRTETIKLLMQNK